ncbi:MAG: YncE family protein [Candidatus Acidiferrales bacterium]
MKAPKIHRLRPSEQFARGVLIAALALVSSAPLTASALKKITSIELPGPAGKRFDYLTIDPATHRLFVAHLGAGNVYVVDVETNKVLNTVANVPGVEGVTFVAELQKLYTSDWGEDTIGVVDLRSMQILTKIPTESKPDGSAYAGPFGKLYVSDERARAVAVVDVKRDMVVKMLRFKSETGMSQYDPVAKKVYVNLQDSNEFAVIDPANDALAGRYPVGRCQGNHGMALDPADHRAFLSCEGNSLLTIFNLDTFAPIEYLKMAPGADVVAYDAGLGRVYVACYSGAISVFERKDADHFQKLADVNVAHAVHSLAIDPSTHRVYVPEQEEDGMPVSRLVVYEAVH